eukprot:ANDGO_02738.mRNA.1 hypothetical protein
MKSAVLLVAFCALLAVSWAAPSANCKYNMPDGRVIDLAKYWTPDGYRFQGANSSVVIQLQICDAVSKPIAANCPPGGAIYEINTQTGFCLSLGAAHLFAIDEVPSQNGVMLTYYNGSPFNNVARRLGRVYFECDASAGKGAPAYEHDHYCDYGYQVHIKFASAAICP